MKNSLIWSILFVAGISVGTASPPADPERLFAAGNEAYRQGQYDSALTFYSRIDSSGLSSPKLYYNMGNAFYKSGEVARSILYYEKALKLDPGNEDIIHNLAMSRQLIADDIKPLPKLFYEKWWDTWRSLTSVSGWVSLSLVFFWIFTMGTAVVITRFLRLQTPGFYIAVAGFILFIIALITAFSENERLNSENEAVVMSQTVKVLSAPSSSAKTLFVIHSGLKVDIRDKIDDKVEIMLPDGRVGWISKSDISVI